MSRLVDSIRPATTDLASNASPLGTIAVGVVNGYVALTTFGHRSRSAAQRDIQRRLNRLCTIDNSSPSPDGPCDAEQVLGQLLAVAAGEQIDLSHLPLYELGRTPFQRRVIAACRQIPWGQTCSYGELAKAAGNPGAARAVGTVMSKNPVPLIVPCHRVLAAGGKLGGYSARQGLSMKRRLIEMEAASLAS